MKCRTTFLFIVISIAFSTLSYGQSHSKLPTTGGEYSKKKTITSNTPDTPPPISDPESQAVHAFSYPNPSRGIFYFSIDNDLGNSSNSSSLTVLVKVTKYGSSKSVFTLRGRYPLGTTIDLTKFGKGVYYLTASDGVSSFSQRLLVE